MSLSEPAGNGPAAPGFGRQSRTADDRSGQDREGAIGMRVLLIDDDALVRQTLADTLAEESIEVDGLANAKDALVLLGAGQVRTCSSRTSTSAPA
jgi:PleD family two-component response regulator